MGYSNHVVTGAFLRVKLREMEIPQERNVCENGHDYGETWGNGLLVGKFCSHCGTVIKVKTVSRRRYPYETELIPVEHEDRLFSPEHSGMPKDELVFVGNMSQERDQIYGDNGGDLGFVPVAAADVDRCIQAFRRNYGDLIALLEPQVESLEVVFGVLRYAH